MEEPPRSYARLRLERAREELETAQENIAHGHFRAAVSRAYYAVFYMASAAPFSQSVQRAKHSGVESAVSQFLVKPGHIEPEFSRLYQRVRRQREEADYADESNIDETTARQALSDAERFVDRLERFLHEIGALRADSDDSAKTPNQT
ncbi:MAG: hypothetical protein A2Z04_00530 [Chloroflexi bacterium RBG_16_57_9]|nr:MAG: hypothetical protein A2Z04_00530 [Chloroflexi bacterium RBG_16_57_9]